MGDLLKGLQGLASHPLGGRVGGDELGVSPLQLLQTAQLMVVVVVGHGGVVLDVVFEVCLVQLFAQFQDLLCV